MNTQLTDELYGRFRDLLLNRCGLYYPERKRADLAHGLNMALNTSGLPSMQALYAAATGDGPVWEGIITCLTIGETYFFRNEPQFEALRRHILPELIGRKAALRSLRVWSAGCATGEEPYSLAITIADMLPDPEAWHVSILASDINPDFLARARAALYGEWSFRETPEPIRSRYFTPEQGRWRLRPEFRRMVNFAQLNLATPSYPQITNGTCALDMIVCRNVTIYFNEATTRQVVERFYRALTPGGWLIVGHAEPQSSIYQQFEVCNFPDTVVYRKPLDAPLFAFEPQSGTFSAGLQPILTPGKQPVLRNNVTTTIALVAPTRATEYTPAKPPAPAIIPRAAESWPAITARLEQGDRAGAEKLLHELLRSEPHHVEALTALGRLCADRSDWASAQRHCAQALELDALYVGAHYLLAQIHEHQQQFDAALAAYRRCVYLDSSFVLGTLGMADVWRQMGRTDEARRSYRSLLRQCATLPPDKPLPAGDGLTAGDLAALAARRLEVLEPQRQPPQPMP